MIAAESVPTWPLCSECGEHEQDDEYLEIELCTFCGERFHEETEAIERVMVAEGFAVLCAGGPRRDGRESTP